MKINASTRVSKIIQYNEAAIDAIASINKNFKKLKNPVLRKLLAPRVKLQDAAKIGGVHIQDVYDILEPLGFVVDHHCEPQKVTKQKLLNMDYKNAIKMDVRPILETGKDPFKDIMAKLKDIEDGKILCVVNSFRPTPLLNILEDKGYACEVKRKEENLFECYIQKSSEAESSEEIKVSEVKISFEDVEAKFKGKMVEIDVREFEMPEPMVKTLEAAEALAPGQALYVNHKRTPQYLIPELEKRGFQMLEKYVDDFNTKLIFFK